MKDEKRGLKRRLNLFLLTFFGIGNILGAGIYVLIGKVAGESGMMTPWAFLLACIIATFTALTYTEISATFPVSAGEAMYVKKGLKSETLSVLVGLLIALSGLVSSATMYRGVVGYVQVFFPLSDWIIISGLILAFGLIANLGIAEAVLATTIFTFIETAGLIMIIVGGFESLREFPGRIHEFSPSSTIDISMILPGTFLAFYAFIGFEDMVNMAEEVIDPRKNMFRGIILSLGTATILYLLVALVSVSTVSPNELSKSSAPLALVFRRSTGMSKTVISAISIFAVLNGALIQIIMASRILYGMSNEGQLPAFLSYVHKRTGSPTVTLMIGVGLVLVFALWLPVETLARTTSFFILIVFVLVNASLIALKIRKYDGNRSGRLPLWIPWAGLISSLLLIFFEIYY